MAAGWQGGVPFDMVNIHPNRDTFAPLVAASGEAAEKSQPVSSTKSRAHGYVLAKCASRLDCLPVKGQCGLDYPFLCLHAMAVVGRLAARDGQAKPYQLVRIAVTYWLADDVLTR